MCTYVVVANPYTPDPAAAWLNTCSACKISRQLVRHGGIPIATQCGHEIAAACAHLAACLSFRPPGDVLVSKGLVLRPEWQWQWQWQRWRVKPPAIHSLTACRRLR